MAQRWVAAALLDAESRFRTVKGFLHIPEAKKRVKQYHEEQEAKAA